MIENPKLVYWSADRQQIANIFGLLKSAGLPVRVEGGQQQHAFAQLRRRLGPLLSKVFYPVIWLFSWGEAQISLYTDQSLGERARELIEAYQLDPTSTLLEHKADVSTIPVRCEACDKQAEFLNFELGTVQHCPHCHEYIDVGAVELADPRPA